jgi:H+-transporting ATPase
MACREENLDVIDMAVLDYARGLGSALDGYKQLSFTPFTPAAKRTEAEAEYKGARLRVIKGAPQVVLGLCPGTDAATAGAAAAAVEGFAAKGYRTLAVAVTDGNGGALRLAGFLPLSDPLRPDSKAMIAEARRLGIRPMMLTGDSLLIAREIARQAGIPGEIRRLPEFEALPAAEQARLAGELGGFAEIYPEDKYKIVKLFQARGHMVGMTGDGVNDAPALKQAELGIAVSNSADVAKAAASVVLTEPGLGVIIDAVKISRRTYQRMLSWVINKVTKVIEFVGLLTVAFFWLDGVVLSLLGMALLVFANDFVTMSLATDNADYTGSPNHWNVKNITLSALVPGLLLVVEGLLVILAGKRLFGLAW